MDDTDEDVTESSRKTRQEIGFRSGNELRSAIGSRSEGDESLATHGRRVEKETGDKHVATDWKGAKDKNEAFKDEANRIKDHGGAKSPDNHNKIESPGKKLLEKENEKPSQ